MKQTKKKQVKNNSKVNEIKVLGIGHYQIEYYIELTDEELKLLGIEDISNLNKLEDFSFLITDQNFINRFDIKTEYDSFNTLLFMNKSLNDNNKLNIEYIPFETPIFRDVTEEQPSCHIENAAERLPPCCALVALKSFGRSW